MTAFTMMSADRNIDHGDNSRGTCRATGFAALMLSVETSADGGAASAVGDAAAGCAAGAGAASDGAAAFGAGSFSLDARRERRIAAVRPLAHAV